LFKWIGKVLNAIKKVLLWVVIVVAVVLVTAFIMAYTPYMLPGWLGNAMGPLLGFLGKIGASAFGASLAGAIGVEVGAMAGSVVTAALAGVGAIASNLQDKKRKKLSGKNLKEYIKVVGSVLKMLKDPNSPCHIFLKDKGFDPKKIADKLRKNTPYDMVTSTNSASDINTLFDQFTIQGLFNGPNAPLSGARAATSSSRRNVYYDPSGIRASTMIHETIHQTSPITDPDLANKIGVSAVDYQKPYSIDDALEKGGCK
jgi:flagellar basal body-associated protein FliL